MLRWSDRRPLPEPAPRLMSVNLDASGIGQLAVKLGLTSEGHVLDCLIELDDRKAPAEQMIRLLERKGFITPWQGRKLLKGDTDGYFLGGFRMLYGWNGDQDRQAWLQYDYRTRWSFKGGGTYETEWKRIDAPMIDVFIAPASMRKPTITMKA